MCKSLALKRVAITLLLVSFSAAKNHSVSKRYVLFPQYTVLQFTYGLSVPLILPSRSINLSFCVQSNFNMPYNLSNFDPVYARYIGAQDEDFDMDRHTFYHYIIGLLDGFGLNGEHCLLRSICEVSEIPMHIDDGKEVLMEKILHYVLTPSHDFNTDNGLSMDINMENSTFNFQEKLLVAEHLGKVHGKCDEIFSSCDISLIDLFTNKFYAF